MGRVEPIIGRPKFATIQRMEKQLITGARKIEYRACKYSYAGDIMDDAPYGLLSVTPWPIPTDPGSYLKLDDTERTDTEVRIEEQKWKSEDLVWRTYMNFRTATRQILENSVERPYQSGATAFSDKGFGSDTP